MFPSGVFDNIHPTSTGQPLAKIIQDCLRYIDLKSLNRHLVLPRSEEHTSELQSPCNLVCRLLLEKKKLGFDIRNIEQVAPPISPLGHSLQKWTIGPGLECPKAHGLITAINRQSVKLVSEFEDVTT